MSVAVSSVKCLLVKASLCLEAAERPQWPRLYSLGRPRSCDRMPSLVGDRGPVLRVLKKAAEELCGEQNRELFSDIKGRGGASSACFHS